MFQLLEYILIVLSNPSLMFYISQQHAHVARKWKRRDLNAVLSDQSPMFFPKDTTKILEINAKGSKGKHGLL